MTEEIRSGVQYEIIILKNERFRSEFLIRKK